MSPLDLSVSDNPFDCLDELPPAVVCDHPTLGFEVSECHIRKRAYISGIARAANVRESHRKRPRVSSKTSAANTSGLSSFPSMTNQFSLPPCPQLPHPTMYSSRLSLLPIAIFPLLIVGTTPQSICRSINSIQSDTISNTMPDSNVSPGLVMRSLNTTSHGTVEEQGAIGSFTRRNLLHLPNWPEWQSGEFKQLDSMAKQQMYGAKRNHPQATLELLPQS